MRLGSKAGRHLRLVSWQPKLYHGLLLRGRCRRNRKCNITRSSSRGNGGNRSNRSGSGGRDNSWEDSRGDRSSRDRSGSKRARGNGSGRSRRGVRLLSSRRENLLGRMGLLQTLSGLAAGLIPVRTVGDQMLR